jgi:hypothetical protein
VTQSPGVTSLNVAKMIECDRHVNNAPSGGTSATVWCTSPMREIEARIRSIADGKLPRVWLRQSPSPDLVMPPADGRSE